MKTESPSCPLESRLLSMLQAGEMLRFAFARDAHNRFALALEGNGDEPSALAQRIGILLEIARRDGYTFLRDPKLDFFFH